MLSLNCFEQTFFVIVEIFGLLKLRKDLFHEINTLVDEYRVKENQLEKKVADTKKDAGNLILDTSDNIFTNDELKKIRILEVWAILGPIAGILICLLF